MPELPEVETLRRDLARVVIGKTLSCAEFLWAKSLHSTTPKKFNEQIKNQKIVDVKRRAKILNFELENKFKITVHLKMTGQLIFTPRGLSLAGFQNSSRGIISGGHPGDPTKHTRVIFHFIDGPKLYFNDLRKFGWIKLIPSADWPKFTSHLGPEPLEKDFTLSYLKKLIAKYPKRKIKQLLLDQTLISGIGNIYADESLFASKILPSHSANKLNENEIILLYKNIKKILKLAITKGGTSIRDYRRASGQKGGFAKYLKVYDRAGDKCLTCAKMIQKIQQNGRGTHFCIICQK